MCDRITFRQVVTKGKQETRSVPVSPELEQLLQNYWSYLNRLTFAVRPYLFPKRWERTHLPEFCGCHFTGSL